MLRMEGVSKTYNGRTYALYDVNLHVAPGEFVFLVGPSGSGKSTLIKLIFREIFQDEGSVYFNGKNVDSLPAEDIPGLRRRLGVVFQDYKLLNDRTVFDNVAFAMRVTEAPGAIIRSRVRDCLELVGLKDCSRAYPEELSGGEQQRVAIARAIVNDPLMIVADEPTGNLDPNTSKEIMEVFKLINRNGTSFIMATHDKNIVDSSGKRVVAIDGGRIVRDEKWGHYGY